MYEIMSMVEQEKRADPAQAWFAVHPAVVYPKTIERIQEVLANGGLPQELVENHAPEEVDPRGVARLYLSDARKVPAEGWGLALRDRSEFNYQDDPEKLDARAQALEVARRWFTQALHTANDGKPIGVHILRDLRFRL